MGKGSSSYFKNLRFDSGFRAKSLNLLQYSQLVNKASIFSCKKCSVVSLEKAAVVDSGNWEVNSWRLLAPSVNNVLTQLESYDVASIP